VTTKARSAVEQLTWHYEHPFAQATEASRKGMPAAGVTSNTVPWELLRAAGYFPVMLNPPGGPFRFADRFMEDGVFSARIRGIFDGIASGAWPFLKLVVVPRTSEQEHKLFLYLHEVARQGLATGLPSLYLYNLLHARSDEAEVYGLERTHEFRNNLEYRAGRSIAAADLAGAVEESNRAARAIRALLDLRHVTEPRLSGTEALALIGAMYFMDRAEYAELAHDAAAEVSRRAPLCGARILIKGSPLHHTGLHRAIESCGAVVVAEDDWWASRAVTREINGQSDIMRGIFEKHYLNTPSPRVFPRETADAWLLAAAAGVEGVGFLSPARRRCSGLGLPAAAETSG
jgi:benzoyl-CoA reductase/2-hydroxyglutaryl-CoA dehydratase subunit BcrC/BadD/HgdB